jgi:hypothetical protein
MKILEKLSDDGKIAFVDSLLVISKIFEGVLKKKRVVLSAQETGYLNKTLSEMFESVEQMHSFHTAIADFTKSFRDDDSILFAQSTTDSEPSTFGLNHSLEHLGEIKDEIHLWEIEKQAEYVDAYTKENVESIRIPDPVGYVDFKYWNATSIGNLAYFGLNSPDEPTKKVAVELLTKYKNWKTKN